MKSKHNDCKIAIGRSAHEIATGIGRPPLNFHTPAYLIFIHSLVDHFQLFPEPVLTKIPLGQYA